MQRIVLVTGASRGIGSAAARAIARTGAHVIAVARTVGKLVGISALTTIGLRVYYRKQADLPAPQDVCPGGRSKCDEFAHLLRVNGLVELHTIFLGAAVCCVIAGVVALVVFRSADTREVELHAFQGEIG